MSETSKIILTPTQEQGFSQAFALTQPSQGQIATIQVIGLQDDEKAYLLMEDFITKNNENVKINGVEAIFDANNNLAFVKGANKYRIQKDGTTESVGVAVFSDMLLDFYA